MKRMIQKIIWNLDGIVTKHIISKINHAGITLQFGQRFRNSKKAYAVGSKLRALYRWTMKTRGRYISPMFREYVQERGNLKINYKGYLAKWSDNTYKVEI